MEKILSASRFIVAIAAVVCIKSVCCEEVTWDNTAPLTGYTITHLLQLLDEINKNENILGQESFKEVLANRLGTAYYETDQKGNARRTKSNVVVLNPDFVAMATDIINRYKPGATTASELKEAIESSLYSVRTEELYNKVGKFVGRINIGKMTATGTGTLIEWEGMDPALKGRVVLTVAHNYCNNSALAADQTHPTEICGIETIVESPTDNTSLHTESRMSFMIDLSKGSNDVVAYSPGDHDNPSDSNHKIVKVKKIYYPVDRSFTVNMDIAIFILENSALQDGGAMLRDNDIEDNEEYFSIGYGMMSCRVVTLSYFEKYMGGWNTKKATLPWQRQTSDGLSLWGPSDSGSPMVNKKKEIAAVLTGTIPTGIKPFFEWIKAVGADYLQNFESYMNE
jgi:hypothetical protein